MDLDKPRRKQATSFHVLDDYPEHDDDFCDSCSDDDSECSQYSYETIDSVEGEASSLFTIPEETEKDLMSRGTCDFDLSERSEDVSPVSTPRIRISLDAYLAKDERRHRPDNLDITIHEAENESKTDASESLNPEEACMQSSAVSFASFGSSANGLLQKSGTSLAGLSMDEDSNSVNSDSTHGSNRLAMLKIQRQLSAQKLKQAIEAAELTSSFRKDEVTADSAKKCIVSLEESLLKSPQSVRASDSYRRSRSNLLSAMTSSREALMVPLE
jgi:hypothetical protein